MRQCNAYEYVLMLKGTLREPSEGDLPEEDEVQEERGQEEPDVVPNPKQPVARRLGQRDAHLLRQIRGTG